MRYIKRQDAFSRMTSERYEPDTNIYCAICGGGIFWPSETIDVNEEGDMCHPKCLEKAIERRNTKFGETKYKPLERPKIEKGTEAK